MTIYYLNSGTLLSDETGKCHILHYSSRKSKRVVRLIMGGEVHAFADGFDRSFTMKKDLEMLLGMPIPLYCFTDSKELFDSVTKGQQTTEKRLMIDIIAARESYKSKGITQIGLIGSATNPADGLSKVNDNGSLLDLMDSGVDKCPVEQWIIRP